MSKKIKFTEEEWIEEEKKVATKSSQLTSIEWLIAEYIKDGLFKQGVYEQAIAMETQQNINAYVKGHEDREKNIFNTEQFKTYSGMEALIKAQELYTHAYTRWALELSHDKNHVIAKDIALAMCNEVLGYMGADRGTEFWTHVREIINKSNHKQLYTK
jgi:hypothetical protein